MHLTQDELQVLLDDAKRKVEVGAIYKHYKSPEKSYLVTDIVIQEIDDQPCVIYQAQYGRNIKFSRPVSSWIERVAVNGNLIPRFAKIS